MGTKKAVSFANIFMAKVATKILNQGVLNPLVWKRFIDDIFSPWNTTTEEITNFIEQANKHHQTIKFTAEVSETQTNFSDTTVYKGERFETESVLDVRTHFKPTETFHYTHFSTCRPSGVKRGLIKGEALRPLRTNLSKRLFEESVKKFKTHLLKRGYPRNLIQTTLSEKLLLKTQGLRQKQKQNK